jgi:hypothetical protein
MLYSPLLPVHIAGGVLGILSGAAAMSFRKGSRWHELAGKVFVAAMLTMSSAAVYLAFKKDETGNVIGGILAFYMVLTAWLTARRGDGDSCKLDWLALVIPLAGGIWLWAIGLEKLFSHTPPKDGVPIGMSFFIGSVMLLCAAGDIRMLAHGGVFGTKRLVRHLWRMCFGLFIATGSFFLGQQKVFPVWLRGSMLLLILGILPLVLLIFWVIRVRFAKAYEGMRQPSLPGSARLQTGPLPWPKLKLVR